MENNYESENLFGDKYTRRFAELVRANLCVKHKNYETVGTTYPEHHFPGYTFSSDKSVEEGGHVHATLGAYTRLAEYEVTEKFL